MTKWANRWGNRPASCGIAERFWVLRFRLMVKRGHRSYGPQASKEKRSMEHFAGLDVSVNETSVCIVDHTGRIVREVKVKSGHSRSLGERGNGGFRDLLAPLLDEVTAVWNLERRGTPAYLLAQCCHHLGLSSR